ncbi:MAG TPA: glycosyltransferase, partial [Anaerolineales bacterium]|nr:glycosyltransferase [Anaerolineales bacterium]
MPSISLIMPCYNRAHDLVRTLEAYDRQADSPDFELIAVDDDSDDATYKVLSRYTPARYALRVERLDGNRGPAAARNRGIELAQAPLILFVGDDIRPDENLVRGHLAAHRRYKSEPEAVLGRVRWPQDLPVNTLMEHIDGLGAQQFSYRFMQDGAEYDYRHFYTANISLKTGFLKSQPRWFDTDFRFAAYEDAELAYRLSGKGLRIHYAAPLVGYHYHYHNIWTFSERQRRSGQMAGVLLEKHPRLRISPSFRYHYRRVLNLFRIPFIIRKPPSEAARWVEEVALRLASSYEWKPDVQLDRLYLAVLGYFYHDGFITSLFRNP